ncbi:hypothetical protein WJX72_006276 [[Myrmecia] bisecta]|uniref:RRM domain-containing protein n=1 Tax=[Myrmecia] bisecta TaxID=41462 RepID=A0AAW1Q036_9CHLO
MADDNDMGAQPGGLEGNFEEDALAAGSASQDKITDAQAELEAMKARLAQMESEASKLRDSQAPAQADDGSSKEEADSRSVYVGNVDWGCTPEELQMHFQSCGTVNRVTILTDKMGNSKGYAYIEFLEVDAVQNALLLDASELRGRQIKVLPKRTNVPGMKMRGRGGFRGRGGRGYIPGGRRGGYGSSYGGSYGYAPRGRGRGRFYSPY